MRSKKCTKLTKKEIHSRNTYQCAQIGNNMSILVVSVKCCVFKFHDHSITAV